MSMHTMCVCMYLHTCIHTHIHIITHTATGYVRFGWRTYLLLCALPALPALALGLYVTNESPRWLVVNGRQKVCMYVRLNRRVCMLNVVLGLYAINDSHSPKWLVVMGDRMYVRMCMWLYVYTRPSSWIVCDERMSEIVSWL